MAAWQPGLANFPGRRCVKEWKTGLGLCRASLGSISIYPLWCRHLVAGGIIIVCRGDQQLLLPAIMNWTPGGCPALICGRYRCLSDHDFTAVWAVPVYNRLPTLFAWVDPAPPTLPGAAWAWLSGLHHIQHGILYPAVAPKISMWRRKRKPRRQAAIPRWDVCRES